MIEKVYSILSTLGLPLDYTFRPDFGEKKMVISYHFFGEKGELYEDGQEAESGGSLQVDLFAIHKTDFTTTKKQIKHLLKDNGFRLVDISTTGENVDGIGKIDHVIFKSNYLEVEEEK